MNRIHQKKELGCRSNGYIRIEDNPKSDTSKNEKKFWDILQGKQTPKKGVVISHCLKLYVKSACI